MKEYEKPELDIILFSDYDLIVTEGTTISTNYPFDPDEDGGEDPVEQT